MASCLICDYSINVPNQAQAAASRQKEIFQVFCKLLGIPEQEIETFAIDYDVENHSPFCNACAHYPLDLSKHEDSRTRIEDEVLALQITICKKLRELSERKIEADGIVREIRNRIEYQDPDVDLWKESNVSRKSSGASFRNRIRKLTPLRSNGSGKGNISIPNTVIAANPVEGYPGNFVVPNDITKIVVTEEVEIKDEPIETFDAMEEAIEYLAGRESLTPGDENMVCSYKEDYNDSIGIDPLSVHQHSDKNVQGILWKNSAEGISGKIVSKSTRSKRRTGSNKKWKGKKRITPVTDDSVSESTRIMPKRKSAIVSKGNQKSQLRKMNSDSENSDSDKNDSIDKDWVDKKELKDLEQQQVKVCKYKEPKDPGENQLELIKYLGEIKTTEDGKLTFRNIEIIEREVNKLECGQCGFISAEGGTYPNSILLVSVRMRKHVMEKHLGGYSCPLCLDRPPAQEFRTQLRHMRLTHSTGIGIECGICTKPYKYQSEAYRLHLFTHKSKEEKEEALGSGVKLTSYGNRENSDDKFHCKDCQKSFVLETQLNRHMESHRDKDERVKERVPCCICGRLQHPRFIKKHERSHHHKKPEPLPRHACTICHRRFPRPYQVSLHVRRAHTGEKPCVCQICSKAFYCYSQLKKHMTSHSTERPFSCSFCSASYKSKHNLQRHQNSFHPTTEETDRT